MANKIPLVLDALGNWQQAQPGDFIAITAGGTGANTAAGALTALGAYPAANPSNFINSAGAPVQSVAGRSGSVILSQSDIAGLKVTDSPTFAAVTAATFTGALSGNATSASTSANLTGGVAGAIPFQTGVGATGFSTAGTAGQIVLSGGTGAPTFINQSGITLQSSQVTNALGFTPYNASNPNNYINVAQAIAAQLTGYVSGSGTVSATDSILQAIQKLNGNTQLLQGGMNYVGTWNATTNIPALASGVGTKGYIYKVTTAGPTVLDGTGPWNIGDFVVFDGTTWDKWDGIATEVTTVAGRTGAVILSQSDIAGLLVTSSPTFAAVTATTFTGNLVGNASTVTTIPNLTGMVTTVGNVTTVVTNANITGDVTSSGSNAATVVGIHGVSLAGLATGLLKITTGTGAPSIAVQADITALLGAGSITNTMLGNSSVTIGGSTVTLGTPVLGLAAPTLQTLTNDQGSVVPPGSIVYSDTTGTFMLASAQAVNSAAFPIGVASASIGIGASGSIAVNGPVTLTAAQWNAITGGSSGLTAGATYWLSQTTPGSLTTSPALTNGTGLCLVKVGQAISTTVLMVNIGNRIQL